jgi:ATPase subunit of ABC transporter with duplicated ATPase domains
MSFLSRYWAAAQQVHEETGIPYGDIYIDPTTIPQETTEAVNDVPADEPTINTQSIDRPEEDGIMPRTMEELEAKFERPNRRLARPDYRDVEDSKGDARRAVHNADDVSDERSGRAHSRKGKAQKISSGKPTSRQRKEHNRALKKLGGGYRVRVRLSKVIVDNETFLRTDDNQVW